VREEHTTGHEMHESEFCLNGPEALLCFRSVGHGLDNLHAEKVVGIALKPFITVCGDLILPIGFCNRWPLVMGVDTTISGNVIKPDYGTIFHVCRTKVVPSLGSLGLRAI